MKNKLILVLLVFYFSLLSISQVFAQNQINSTKIKCGTSFAMKEFYKNVSSAELERKHMEIDYQNLLKMSPEQRIAKLSKTKATTTYIIPVVFHVYGTTQNGKQVTIAVINEAIKRVNEDYNGLTADWNTTNPIFASVKATLDIEFKLATIDPDGNPTTGMIIHPVASGYGNGTGYDALIAADSWDNYKYMNVYIQADLYNDEVTNNSGVAWYPSTSMSDAGTSRVVYNGQYLSTNTDLNFCSVLTHEFGHWLNLAHTFENGCSAPGDYVTDTPYDNTDDGCAQQTSCTEIENTENFMDYTDCYKMFTQGQVYRMVSALNDSPARKPLWQISNLIATGTYSGDVEPEADFSISVTNPCPGSTVNFIDESTGPAKLWAWSFPGGTPDTSIEQTPSVVYETVGTYDVTLVVTNDLGSDTVVKSSIIIVGSTGLVPPITETFNGEFPPESWVIYNPDNLYTWIQREDVGNNAPCMVMNNADNSVLGEIDEITFPAIDLSNVSDATFRFDVAYTMFNTSSPDILKLYGTNKCNPSSGDWIEIYSQTHTDLETASVSEDQSNDWVPTLSSHWRYEQVDISQFDGDSYVLIKFRNISGYGTRIWIDNVNIGIPSAHNELIPESTSLEIFPNPGNGLYNIVFSTSVEDNYLFEVRNMIGQIVYNKAIPNIVGEHRNTLDLSELSDGMYILGIKNSKLQKTIKLIKF